MDEPVASAVALLQAERDDLAARVARIDAALAALRGVAVDPVAGSPAPTPASEVVDTSPVPSVRRPAGSRPRRRGFSASTKRAGADLGREIGAEAAAAQLDLDVQTIEAWMRWFPADQAEETTPAAAPDPSPRPTPLTRPGPRGGYECSCGWSGDAEGWQRHNDKLHLAEYRDHKLVRRAAS